MKAMNIATAAFALCIAPCIGAAQAVAGAAEDFKRAQSLFWGDKDRGNDAEGVALVIRAGEAGYAEAQDYLALMYDVGLFVQADPQASVLWAQKAAAQKHPESMVRMAFKYLHANGVARDPVKARALLEEAAALGDAQAMANLGALYGMGHDVPQDNVVSAHWYRRAADLGNEHGKWGLAQMYLRGHGVEKSYVECYFWASQVNAKIYPKAPSLTEICRQELSRKERLNVDARLSDAIRSEPPIKP